MAMIVMVFILIANCTVWISGLWPDSSGPQPWQSKIVAGNKVHCLYSQWLFYSARAGAGGCLVKDQTSILYCSMSVIWAVCARQQNGDWSHFGSEFCVCSIVSNIGSMVSQHWWLTLWVLVQFSKSRRLNVLAASGKTIGTTLATLTTHTTEINHLLQSEQ